MFRGGCDARLTSSMPRPVRPLLTTTLRSAYKKLFWYHNWVGIIMLILWVINYSLISVDGSVAQVEPGYV
jgi:hypothetical protein